MSVLTAVRRQLAEALADYYDDAFVTPYVPEDLDLPALMIQAAPGAWVEAGGTYDPRDALVTYQLVIIPAEQTAETALDAIEARLCRLIPLLNTLGWATGPASAPRLVTANGWAHFGSFLDISTHLNLTT